MRPECHGGRNLHLRSEPVLDLMGKHSNSLGAFHRSVPSPTAGSLKRSCRTDHESILGHVVDAAGWNIQVRDCLLGKQEPHEPHPERLQRAWHFGEYCATAAPVHADPQRPAAGRLRGGVVRHDARWSAADARVQSQLVHLRPHRRGARHDARGAGEFELTVSNSFLAAAWV